MGLEERVIVITGATGGLGRVVSREMAQQGARLALVSTNTGHLAELARELSLPPERLLTQPADLANQPEVQATADEVIHRFGRVDVLLNLVGGWIGGKPVVEVQSSEVSKMLEQHLWSTIYLAQAFVPHLLANHWGRIIAVSSPVASRPVANRLP